MTRIVSKQLTKSIRRARRHARVRANVAGTADRPRLSVFRSLDGIFAQLVDDAAGRTLVSAGVKDVDAKTDAGERKGKVADAYRVGHAIAKKAHEKKITAAVYDRGGYRYHGRVQAVADGARDGGLSF